MNDRQQRRLASFIVTRENLRAPIGKGVRCSLADYQLLSNGSFVVEIQSMVWGGSGFPAPFSIALSSDEVEDLRMVWAYGTLGADAGQKS